MHREVGVDGSVELPEPFGVRAKEGNVAEVGSTTESVGGGVGGDGYYVAYKPITLPCILFMFIEMKFIQCHSCVMFAMKSMSMCND